MTTKEQTLLGIIYELMESISSMELFLIKTDVADVHIDNCTSVVCFVGNGFESVGPIKAPFIPARDMLIYQRSFAISNLASLKRKLESVCPEGKTFKCTHDTYFQIKALKRHRDSMPTYSHTYRSDSKAIFLLEKELISTK